MGWSASALHWGEKARDPDPEILLEFRNASEEVIRLAGSVDDGLSSGDLVCSPSDGYLRAAIGEYPRGGGIILPEEVQSLGATAKWEIPPPEEAEYLWAYWSALKFFELCLKHHLGIWIEPRPPRRQRDDAYPSVVDRSINIRISRSRYE